MTSPTTTPRTDGEPVVDVHAHLVPADLLDALASGRTRFPNVEVRPHEGSHTVAFAGGPPTRPVSPGLTDPVRRGEWLDARGVGRQLVGGWLDVFGYGLEASEGADWAELLTDALVEQTRGDDRLLPLGTVPLQAPERAAAALRAQRAAGIPGVMIATRANGRDLDDPAYTPFWEAAHESGAIVFLHPGFGSASDRYTDFGLVNGLARLEDTTVTLARLLYAGIPARYPGMRMIVAHGGAALPYVLGRLTRNHLMHKDSTADPVESFSHLYFDTVVFDPEALEFLVRKAGPGRVLLGSDYPFPIGDLAPREVVERAPFKPEERAQVLGRTAAALLEGAR